MNTKKITLLSLIGLLTIIYILQLTFDSKGKIKEVKPKIPITKIEVINSKNQFTLQKENDNWIVDSLPANTEIAEYVLSSLDNIKIIDTVSKNPTQDELTKYGFDNLINVSGYSIDEKLVQKIQVGKTSSTGNQTYIKLDGKKSIYLVSGNLIIPFNLSSNELLDYTLYSTNPDEIYKIQKYDGERAEENLDFTIEKTGEVAQVAWTVNGQSVLDEQIESWLRAIESLTALEWIEDFDELNIAANPDLTFVISAAGRDIVNEFYFIEGDDNRAICICSENGYPCYVARSSVQKYLEIPTVD